jgi:hypothetical protein
MERSHFDGEPTKPSWRADGGESKTGCDEFQNQGPAQLECENCSEDSTSQTSGNEEDEDDTTSKEDLTLEIRQLDDSDARRRNARRRRRGSRDLSVKDGWGGKVALVLEMWVRSVECRGVRHMLHEIEEFGHAQVIFLSDKIGSTQCRVRA